MTDDARARLKKTIEEHAFVRADTVAIVARSSRGRDSNWLFDMRAILLSPDIMRDTATLFWEKHSGPLQIGGMESAAIPLVTSIVYASDEMKKKDVSGFFIRKSRKKDGLMKVIEGTLDHARPVILVDDLLNSGKSLLKQVAVLEELGYRVERVWCIIRFRDESYYDVLAKKGITIESEFTLDDFKTSLGVENLEPKPTLAEQSPFHVVWKFKSEKPSLQYVVPKSDPVIDDTRAYMGSDAGIMWALNQTDGSVAWSYKIGSHPKGKGIFSSPALHEKTVYFGGYDGNVYALDAETGAKKWISFEADWVGSSPALAPDIGTLFIGLEYGLWRKRGGIAALDMKTGETKWAYREMPCYTHASPLYIRKNKQVVIGSNDGAVHSFDAQYGSLQWKFESGNPSESELQTGFSRFDIKESCCYDEKNDRVIFANMNGDIIALDRKTGTEKLRFKAEFGCYSTPVVYRETVLISSLDKHLFCLDIDTFAEKWRWSAGARIFATPLVIENSIYIGANTGRLTELDAEKGKEKSFIQCAERITNRVAYNPKTERFFVPTFANELYCVERTQKE